MTEKQLLDLKKEIDQSKTKLSELKGKKEALMDTLEKTYGCKSIKAAEKKLTQLKEKVESLEEEKQEGIKELEEHYDF